MTEKDKRCISPKETSLFFLLFLSESHKSQLSDTLGAVRVAAAVLRDKVWYCVLPGFVASRINAPRIFTLQISATRIFAFQTSASSIFRGSDFCISDFLVSDIYILDFLVSDFYVSDFLVSDFYISDFLVSDFCISDVLVSDDDGAAGRFRVSRKCENLALRRGGRIVRLLTVLRYG